MGSHVGNLARGSFAGAMLSEACIPPESATPASASYERGVGEGFLRVSCSPSACSRLHLVAAVIATHGCTSTEETGVDNVRVLAGVFGVARLWIYSVRLGFRVEGLGCRLTPQAPP